MSEIEVTVDVIIQLVNGCGFPIVAFFALLWLIINDRRKRAEENAKWQETLAANTESIKSVKNALDNLAKKVKGE